MSLQWDSAYVCHMETARDFKRCLKIKCPELGKLPDGDKGLRTKDQAAGRRRHRLRTHTHTLSDEYNGYRRVAFRRCKERMRRKKIAEKFTDSNGFPPKNNFINENNCEVSRLCFNIIEDISNSLFQHIYGLLNGFFLPHRCEFSRPFACVCETVRKVTIFALN